MTGKNELLERIEDRYDKMSKGQKRLADYIRASYEKAVFMTASRLGEVVGVSESTVVRFAVVLGYKGYPQFQKALEELVSNRLNFIQRMEVTYGRVSQSEILMSVLQSDIEKIKLTMEHIDQNSFGYDLKRKENLYCGDQKLCRSCEIPWILSESRPGQCYQCGYKQFQRDF